MTATPITDAWRVNCKHTLYLLEELTQEQLEHKHTARSKTVAAQFRHIGMIRKAWLEAKAPALGKAIVAPAQETTDLIELKAFLELTGDQLAQVLETAETTGKLKGSKSDPTMFLAYACAHEAHHRGQILVYLKIGGLPFDKLKSYKLWEWK